VQRARALNLEMKVSDAEWQFDRRRLTFYFTAEERIDFRSLVRQLETHFAVRVQMWHIGPRDEAKRLDGIGHCGRQLCSSSWLPELLPVKTSLAKEQRLSTITPTQISGACGRLMCCLRYEHEFYVQARKRFPKHGKLVQTLQGEEKVDATDIFRDLVTLRNPEGELRTIPLAQFKRELAGDTVPSLEESQLMDLDSDDGGDGEERAPVASPARPPMAQLQRAPSSSSRDQQARDKPTRARGERGSARGEPRSGRSPRRADAAPPAPPAPPAAAAAAATPASASGQASEPHTQKSSSPTPAPVAAPAQPPATSATPPVPHAAAPVPAEAHRAAETPGGEGDAEQRRGRRRRGRRGGRRHRGDGSNHGKSDGPAGPPPQNPNG
jgi:hypothetical protein